MSQLYREGLKRRLICNDSGVEDFLTFEARCVRKFGPAAGIFLRQLVYWVGKEHNQEGWIYKTQREMEDETGLSRRHQENARNILISQGVLEERKKGLPRKLWYWVDLEALLDMMNTPHSTLNQWARKQENNAAETTDIREGASQDSITEHTDEIDSTAQASLNSNTHPASEDDSSAPASEHDITYRPITESTSETTAESSSEKFSSENSNFQFGEDHASRGLSPHEDAKTTRSLKPSVDNRVLTHIYHLWNNPDTEAHQAYLLHREGNLSLPDLASEVCLAVTGSRDQAESYVEPVRRMVAEFAMDDDAGEPPPGGRQNHVT
jgi:hypothetical protein